MISKRRAVSDKTEARANTDDRRRSVVIDNSVNEDNKHSETRIDDKREREHRRFGLFENSRLRHHFSLSREEN